MADKGADKGADRPASRDLPFLLRESGGPLGANLPECALLAKRAPSHPTGISSGLTDFSDITAPGTSFALSGPSTSLDPQHLPVRGDLAHIRLAGKVFVPHYVVPMPHTIAPQGAELLKAGRDDAEVISQIPGGTVFNVLDSAGRWAWGQAGEDGPVGYVELTALEPLA